eukprot:CAMPEP_0172674462 /NCGR_PEP_ID=MMETSP1074-20121228/12747_1 /TAXON_ID=2916 /ORGANISM="Ceratium fusus, Strain PA161109" /LENGTH=747 /DNA_ID=CAMNT_0013491871 /DNA_START=130 /DNA_END=2373 /DNA_ORIENTATION=+
MSTWRALGRSKQSVEPVHQNVALHAKKDYQRRYQRSMVATQLQAEEFAQRSSGLRWLAGNSHIITPYSICLDLLFFRRVFSSLYKRYGDSNGEIPLSAFQRSILRIFRLLEVQDAEFDAEEYDADNSGAVGWYEFICCWRKSQAHVNLSFCERIFLAMEDPSICIVGRIFSYFVTALIFLSCVLFIFGTLPSVKTQECDKCEPSEHPIFFVIESICIGVFTAEYLLRFTTAPFSRNELLDYERILTVVTDENDMALPSPAMRFLRFILSPMNLIDVFVIVPFYAEFVLAQNLSNFTVLRVLRLTRLFRLIKLGSYMEDVEIFLIVFFKSTKTLYMLSVYLILGVCFSSAAIYYVEAGSWDPDAQEYMRISHDGDRAPTPFRSIPHCFWWCVVTFTTVGYGDEVPVTILGKLVAAATMVVGILVLAMPISVISMNFSKVWEDWSFEKEMQAQARRQDLLSVSKALQTMENRTTLCIELFDARSGREAAEFLGEATWTALPLDSLECEAEERVLPLQPNWEKRKVANLSGSVLVGFVWHPTSQNAPEDLQANSGCQGKLEVRVLRAEGLPMSDWKKNGQRDIFAIAYCWPNPPEAGGDLTAENFRTSTACATLQPVWEESKTFNFNWPVQGMADNSRAASKEPCLRDNYTAGCGSNGRSGETHGAELATNKSTKEYELVEAQGRDIRQLAIQVSMLRDLLLEVRSGLRGAGGGGTPTRPPTVVTNASFMREHDDSEMLPNVETPNTVED